MSANIHETIEVATDPVTTFDYVANFGNLKEWDPTFEESTRVDSGPLAVGSTFDVRTSMGPAEIEIRYRITDIDRPTHVKLVGEADSFTSIDVIEFTPREDGGTTVDYDATVDTNAPDWLDALGTPLFKLVGKLGAARGLEETLGSAD